MEDQRLIQQHLHMNPSCLQPQTVEAIHEGVFRRIRSMIQPKACYTNAFLVGISLEAKAVVYGSAVVFGGLPIEHAWLRMADGRLVDPTFQRLAEQGIDHSDARYFALVEVPLGNYAELTKQPRTGELEPRDVFWFRTQREYEELFQAPSVHQPHPPLLQQAS